MRKNELNLLGQKFGILTVVEKIYIDNRKHWKCVCDCGNEKITTTALLRNGAVSTCGCKGMFKYRQKKALDKYYVNGTYLAGIKKDKAINSNNTSGYRGVSYRKDRNKYRAYIRYQRKYIFLGYYDNIEDAIKARQQAEEKYFRKVLSK